MRDANIVYRVRLVDDPAFMEDGPLDDGPGITDVMPLQHEGNHAAHFLKHNIRDEAKPAGIDADNRAVVLGEAPADPESCPVPAEHDGDIGFFADRLNAVRGETDGIIKDLRCGLVHKQ